MKNVVMACLTFAAFAGCTQPRVASEESSDVASAQGASDQVSLVTGPKVIANCNEVAPAALKYHVACPNPATETSGSVSQEILCINLLPERLAMYPACVVSGGIATAITPTAPTQPPSMEDPDIEAYADSGGNLGELGETNSSESQLSSIDGIKSATQTSGGITVSVSSGADHPSLPKFD